MKGFVHHFWLHRNTSSISLTSELPTVGAEIVIAALYVLNALLQASGDNDETQTDLTNTLRIQFHPQTSLKSEILGCTARFNHSHNRNNLEQMLRILQLVMGGKIGPGDTQTRDKISEAVAFDWREDRNITNASEADCNT